MPSILPKDLKVGDKFDNFEVTKINQKTNIFGTTRTKIQSYDPYTNSYKTQIFKERESQSDENKVTSDEVGAQGIRNLFYNGFYNEDVTNFHPNVFSKMFDEPTYLTFKVMFDFDPRMMENYSPAYNMSSKYGTQVYNSMPQPLLALLEDTPAAPWSGREAVLEANNIRESVYGNLIEQVVGGIKQVVVKGDNSQDTYYSTFNYLKNWEGDFQRAYLLKRFIAALKDIQENYPYYFTSVEGLNNLATVDPKRGTRVPLENGIITLNYLPDSIDLKMSQLMEMYHKIAWDDTYQRWVLPDMMRFFKMRIYVSEMRLFHSTSAKTSKPKEGIMYGNEQLQYSRYMRGNTAGKALNAINNVLDQAVVLSTDALGTQSTFTKFVKGVDKVGDTIRAVTTSVSGELMRLCNNALNDVMPTICYECSMCEFDIENTNAPYQTLQSSTKDSKQGSHTGSIKIHVGNVKETQFFPLNMSLKTTEQKYEMGTQLSAQNLGLLSDDTFGYWFLSDDALNAQWGKSSTDRFAFATGEAPRYDLKNIPNPSVRMNLMKYEGGNSDETYGYRMHATGAGILLSGILRHAINKFSSKNVLSAATSLQTTLMAIDNAVSSEPYMVFIQHNKPEEYHAKHDVILSTLVHSAMEEISSKATDNEETAALKALAGIVAEEMDRAASENVTPKPQLNEGGRMQVAGTQAKADELGVLPASDREFIFSAIAKSLEALPQSSIENIHTAIVKEGSLGNLSFSERAFVSAAISKI
mgnify:FL=1